MVESPNFYTLTPFTSLHLPSPPLTSNTRYLLNLQNPKPKTLPPSWQGAVESLVALLKQAARAPSLPGGGGGKGGGGGIEHARTAARSARHRIAGACLDALINLSALTEENRSRALATGALFYYSKK
jgi:hypothetical protein